MTPDADGLPDPGEKVKDVHAAGSWPAVVVSHSGKTAADHVIPESALIEPGTTVADLNPEFPADDPVIIVAFLPEIKRTVPHWERLPFGDDPDVLAKVFDAYEAQWSVEPTTYAYPASRLRPHDPDHDHDDADHTPTDSNANH